MIKKTVLFICVLALVSFTFSNNFRELVINKLNEYSNNHPEKIYLQTDKPYYALGDDIWYTAYLINGITHKKTNKSRVVYVELVNPQDSVVLKKQLYTNDISVAGDFKITGALRPGNYMLRAYTNYMRNKDADYFFKKEIPIWNVIENDSISKSKVSFNNNAESETLMPRPDISFYPEGGYLINGLISKVGIKVKDAYYSNHSLSGTINDSDDNIIASFKTFKYGLAVISLKPEIGKTYYASVNINNKTITYPLPKTLPNGYNLNIVNNGNQIVLKTNSNTDIGLKNTFLVAHQRGQIIFERLLTETSNSFIIKLNTTALPEGVTNFTLFDSNGKPVCERLVYIDNLNEDIKVNLNIDKKTPKTRDQVALQLALKDKSGNPISGNFSMSITDTDVIGQSTKSENIKTYLLLNSDLRGQINEPGYFFEKENDPKRRYLLDLVMLTHGWRRFTWNDILYNKQLEKNNYQPETGIYITGHTSALKGDRQQIPAATRLTLMVETPYQEKKQTASNGTFKYGPFIFNDTIPTLIEARVKDFKSDTNRKNRFVSIFLDEEFNNSPKVNRAKVLKPHLGDSIQINNFINQAEKISKIDAEFLKSARLLDEVVITAQRKSDDDKRREELNGRTDYGAPTNRLDMRDFENQDNLTILDLLNTLPGVTSTNDSISIRGQGTPRIFLDGIPAQLQDISFVTAAEVDFIDVLKGADAAFFSGAGNGVIAIYSRTGANIRTTNIKRKPGIIDFKAIGFYTARQFYAPDHINGFDEALKPDIRTTLHWEPKITLTSQANTAKISFFTSDAKSNYAIKIEGITDTGIPIHHLSTFEVR
ncbi:TonB-dependent receptor plug domain-containing protein [uncultured Algibacter sp.]|uniref:TonB-dependent receptor plug domain-containing protein n=1 Tax=uncultured Algibacter sp. TaxID=298659 RepID=UPI0032166550